MEDVFPSTPQGDDAPGHEDEPRKTMQCQAVGCTADLRADGKYCMKRRLCREHLKATSLLRKRHGPDPWRFCQQCGKLEPLDAFDAAKRSCRVQLLSRRKATAVNQSNKPRCTDNGSSSSSMCHQVMSPPVLHGFSSGSMNSTAGANVGTQQQQQQQQHMQMQLQYQPPQDVQCHLQQQQQQQQQQQAVQVQAWMQQLQCVLLQQPQHLQYMLLQQQQQQQQQVLTVQQPTPALQGLQSNPWSTLQKQQQQQQQQQAAGLVAGGCYAGDPAAAVTAAVAAASAALSSQTAETTAPGMETGVAVQQYLQPAMMELLQRCTQAAAAAAAGSSGSTQQQQQQQHQQPPQVQDQQHAASAPAHAPQQQQQLVPVLPLFVGDNVISGSSSSTYSALGTSGASSSATAAGPAAAVAVAAAAAAAAATQGQAVGEKPGNVDFDSFMKQLERIPSHAMRESFDHILQAVVADLQQQGQQQQGQQQQGQQQQQQQVEGIQQATELAGEWTPTAAAANAAARAQPCGAAASQEPEPEPGTQIPAEAWQQQQQQQQQQQSSTGLLSGVVDSKQLADMCAALLASAQGDGSSHLMGLLDSTEGLDSFAKQMRTALLDSFSIATLNGQQQQQQQHVHGQEQQLTAVWTDAAAGAAASPAHPNAAAAAAAAAPVGCSKVSAPSHSTSLQQWSSGTADTSSSGSLQHLHQGAAAAAAVTVLAGDPGTGKASGTAVEGPVHCVPAVKACVRPACETMDWKVEWE